ncbi:DUF1102 domain-containing protein [Halorubrum terrestre]|uniref:DUF1102 domain-containing protein n=1 Tax=Halorubrum distributum TaxID=29283 RepID=A0A6B1ISN5_9EURY|nr:DUF1102 domain-containing protein [Halorubrum terrestre]MYL18144.1 DUF1102 domain-containing protein [Halorubrum terrestre]
MNRRNFVAGIGATVAGGAIATGTGAFTSVQADRSVSIAVGDEEASSYLVLDALAQGNSENGAFASNSGGSSGTELTLDFNSEIPDPPNAEGGEGPGKNSTYEFDEVFEVQNQGTQDVDVAIETLDNTQFEDTSDSNPTDTLTLSFYPDSDAGSPLDGNPESVAAGGSLTVGVKIEIGNVNFESYSAEATVIADADSGQISF